MQHIQAKRPQKNIRASSEGRQEDVVSPEEELDLLQTLALGLRDEEEAEEEDDGETAAEHPERPGL